ncbi:MAG: hypothetical protein NC485_06220 [Ruminococcus flavefaciens]|nr:hypothetical protein [Ruminococcus flavefaciens]MCM1060428.1 hypothetical protein [Eubacterium sp.]
MNITAKEIKEIESKTYAYLSSVVIGFLSADILLLIYSFISNLQEYLTYHNSEDDHGEKLHYVDLNALWLCGCLGVILILIVSFVWRFWIRKIKCIEKRLPVMIISSVLALILLPVWGYISICIMSLIEIIS